MPLSFPFLTLRKIPETLEVSGILDVTSFLVTQDKDIISAYDDAISALEKQIPQRHFINECECIVDYESLYKAIDNKCKSLNCYFNDKYRIVLKNNYPAVCINR